MKRRDLILATGAALVPALGRSAQPCPPPTVTVAGGQSVATDCQIVSGPSYSTSFPNTENPLSEGGRWINGRAVGGNWNNVQSMPGRAIAAGFVSGYDDPIAVLTTSFAANQYAEGTVFRATGYSPSASHEIELLLRFQITSGNARGYEVLWGAGGEVNVVRWNGPLGNYTPVGGSTGPNIGAARDGDIFRAEISGTIIRVYRNGALVLTRDVSSVGNVWTTGQPGMGFFPRTGATLANYGWKSYRAGSI